MVNMFGDLLTDEIRAISRQNAARLYDHPLTSVCLP
jgi:hypothetical protein